MGIVIEFADAKGGRMGGDEVANNSGWAEFGAWVDTLPAEERYRHVICLWEYGYEFKVIQLAQQLRQALKDTKPKKHVREVAENVLVLIDRHIPRVKKNPEYDGIFVYDGS
jgi:hypothetical protein